MEQKNKSLPIASILLFVYAFYLLFTIWGSGFYSFLNFLLLASVVFAGVWMLLNKRDMFLAIPFGVIALTELIRLFMRVTFVSVLSGLCSLAAALIVGALALAEFTEYLKAIKSYRNTLKIVLLATCAASVFLYLFNLLGFGISYFSYFRYVGFGRWFLGFLMTAVYNAGVLLTGFWILPEAENPLAAGASRNNYDPETGEYIGGGAAGGGLADCYIDLLRHIMLLLFTFGVWHYIWVYRMTQRLNRAPGAEQFNPTNKLLLCMFVPCYSIYWYYRSGQRMDTLSNSRGYQGSEMSTLCLILGIFVPFVADIILQERMNTLAKIS